MKRDQDVQVHALEVLEAALNQTASSAAAPADELAETGFAILSPTGFAILSPTGFAGI